MCFKHALSQHHSFQCWTNPRSLYLHQHLFVKVTMFCKACSVSLHKSAPSDTGSPSAYLTLFSSVLFSIVDLISFFLSLSFPSSIWREYLIPEFYPFNFNLIPSLWASLYGTGAMWIFEVKKTGSLLCLEIQIMLIYLWCSSSLAKSSQNS